MPEVSIHWFRRDLRLTDNTALHFAAKESRQVIPVYILSEWKKKHSWTGPARQLYLCGCLESLAHNLESLGTRLIVRQGDAVKELKKLVREAGATAIYTNSCPDPYGKEKEKELADLCRELNVELHTYTDATLHGPKDTLKPDGEPYRVFTPFYKNWAGLPKSSPYPKVTRLGPAPETSSLPLPTLKTWNLEEPDITLPKPGERAARDRMKDFTDDNRINRYADRRDIPSEPGTSQLSPDLRFGLIGIREMLARCRAHHGKNAETYVKELAWREFYMAVLHHWPDVLDQDFNPAFRSLPWEGDDELVEKWRTGMTGFPIVDAGMRQMLSTGWMHNRVRMIVSMFLTKDLHAHWRVGEQHFMQHLIDGEIASNNGGWQWSAGTGADAAPYFRIQNPWTQTKTYDPKGLYIKRWVPELKDVSPEKFFAPPSARLHKDYPLPIVDHAEERARTLKLFKLAQHS